MSARAEYIRILAAHGRRAANRFAYAELRESGHGPKGMAELEGAVVNMYWPDDHLPEDERHRPGDPVLAFDPCGVLRLYPKTWVVRAARAIKGTSKDWAAEIRGTDPRALSFLRAVLSESKAALARLDEPDMKEWREFDDSLNEMDALALYLLLFGTWPAPGTIIPESWLASKRKGK